MNKTSKQELKKPAKESLSEQIGMKAKRKLKARHHSGAGMWFGLGMMGLIGWSIAIPTLLGTALGVWLDKHYADERSWTLALLLAGLIIGCFTAWSWVNKEDLAIQETNKDEEQDE